MTTNSLTLGRALVVMGSAQSDIFEQAELTAKELGLLAEKKELEAKVTGLKHSSSELQSAIAEFSKEMDEEYADTQAVIRALKAELEELLLANFGKTEVTDDQFKEYLRSAADNVKDQYKASQEHNERLSQKGKKSHKSEGVKRIFRKIAAKAHPDKTDKEDFHKLFKMAKEAYNNNDYNKLEQIWKCIARKTTWTLLKLEEEVAELRVQEVLLVNEVHGMVSSDLFNMMRDYRSKIPFLTIKAKSYYKVRLEENIKRLKADIRAHDPSRYKEPEKNSVYTSDDGSIFITFTSIS
jgi:hypothetical protein